MVLKIIGEAETIPPKGTPCDCAHRKRKENDVIFENTSFSLSFGLVQIIPLDGPVINKGWGLNLVNHKSRPDKSYVFNYCPWCGGVL